MRRLAPLIAGVALILGTLDCARAEDESADQSASLAAFARMASVMMSPRCQNCHTVTAFPRQGDDRHRHQMNVMRGADGHGAPGMRCATCHGTSNNRDSGVPGSDDWHLAPLSMGWEGLSRRELSFHLKDAKRNGGRSGAGVIDHLKTHLVAWAWEPGIAVGGVARTVPPLGYAAFLQAAQTWVAGGQPCPDPHS